MDDVEDLDDIFNESIFAAVEDVESSIQSTSIVDNSFSSCFNEAVTSTPNPKHKPKQDQNLAPTSSTRLKAPSSNRLPCPTCSNTYANAKTLATHLKMHAMRGAVSNAPNLEEIQCILEVAVQSTLTEMSKEASRSTLGQSVQSFCDSLLLCIGDEGNLLTSVLSEEFYGMLKSQNALLPSALRSAMLCHHNKLMSNDNFLLKLQEHLHNLCDCEAGVLKFFIGHFTFKLFPKVLSKCLLKMQGKMKQEGFERTKRSSDDLSSNDFLQLVYHIAGSIIRGFLQRGKTYHRSEVWAAYVDVLNAKFLRQPLAANECSDIVRAFTEQKERYALKHCNQEAVDFFFVRFGELMSLEESDGSLPLKVAEEHVYKHDLLVLLWDDIVGSELNEDQSLTLLEMTIHSACRVVSKGILKRRLSEELQKAYSSVSLRSRLAR